MWLFILYVVALLRLFYELKKCISHSNHKHRFRVITTRRRIVFWGRRTVFETWKPIAIWREDEWIRDPSLPFTIVTLISTGYSHGPEKVIEFIKN